MSFYVKNAMQHLTRSIINPISQCFSSASGSSAFGSLPKY